MALNGIGIGVLRDGAVAIGGAGKPRQAGDGFDVGSPGDVAAAGALVTETGRRDHDQGGVLLAQDVVAEAEFFENARAVVVDDDVGLRRELAGDFDGPGLSQIEPDEALSGVPIGKPGRELGLNAQVAVPGGGVKANDVGPFSGFDPHAIGAAVRENTTDPGAGHRRREFEHAKTLEGGRGRILGRRREPRRSSGLDRRIVDGGEDLLPVLVELRGGPSHPPGRLLVAVGRAGLPKRARHRVVDVDKEFASGQVGVPGDARGSVDRGYGQVALLRLPVEIIDIELDREVSDEDVEQIPILDAVRGGTLEEGVEYRFVIRALGDPPGQGLPVERAVDHQVGEAVAAAVAPGRHRGKEAGTVAHGDDAVIEPLSDAADVTDGSDDFLERDVDVLAPAGSCRAVQGDQAACGGRGTRAAERLGARQPNGRIIGFPGDEHGASHGVGHEVPAPVVAMGAGLPERRDRGEHEFGARGVQDLQIEVARREIARREALDHQVGVAQELLKPGAIPGVVEVEREAALVRRGVEEWKAPIRAPSPAGKGRVEPGRVSLRRLHENHVGPEVGE